MASRKRRRSADEPLGVLYVDKPAGPTSGEVCDFLRWALRTRAVGHCGTLDPGATGLLVCCVGPATKLVPMLTEADKTYRAVFRLGTSTRTDDAAGEVLARAPVSDAVWERAPETLQGMLGAHQLRPPAFSAIRVDGERAHARARRGEAVEVPHREMRVLSIEAVAERDRGALEGTLRVSKGTFIRSLAVELGRRLGVPAHLQALHRVASGSCTLDDPRAVTGFDVTPLPPRPDGKPRHRLRVRGAEDSREGQADRLRASLVGPAEALSDPTLDISQNAHGIELVRRLGHGQPVGATDPALRGCAPTGRLVVRAGAGVVLCRFEGEGDDAVLRVERTLRPLAFETPADP